MPVGQSLLGWLRCSATRLPALLRALSFGFTMMASCERMSHPNRLAHLAGRRLAKA